MKRILVPCDFSRPARQAFKFAVDLANVSKGEVFVTNMIGVPIIYESAFGIQPYPLEATDLKKLEENAREAFEEMLNLEPSPASVPVHFFAVYDYLIPGVADFTETNKIDLIVMGTTGSSGLEEFFIGSNTEKIVRFSKVPVIAVHEAKSIGTIKNIVVPTTLPLNQHDFMSRVKALQQFFDARLHLLVVNTPAHFKSDRDLKEAAETFAKFYKLENYTVNFRNDQSERNGIINFANDINADMIAMATHGRQGLAHLFMGSLTESVVNHARWPIWTYSVRK